MNIKRKLVVFGIVGIMAVTSAFAFSGCTSSDEKSKTSSSQNEKKADSSADNSVESSADSAAVSDAQPAPADAPVVQEAAPEQAPAPEAPKASEPAQNQAPEKTKYGDAEIYKNANGKDAAKTESGVEVELTGENMQKLLEDYQKVQGSGSEDEKQLLDQIQLLLEASQNVQK